MDLSKYGRSPSLGRRMHIMDTVSGRIPPDSAGDAYIQISGLESRNKDLDHMGNHVADGESRLPGIMTCSSMNNYSKSKGDAIQQIVYDDDFRKNSMESNRSTNSNIMHRRKHTCRFIKKSGHCNVSHAHLKDKPKRFMADIFTTCVDLRWRWNLLLFTTAFIVSWILFGTVYWLISLVHGDFSANPEDRPVRSCIKDLDPEYAFTSAFLFSLETQTTIGYGSRSVTEECSVAIIMVVVQSVFGCIIDAFMIGLIMAKISRPKKRAETLLFSKKAVINVRDGQLCLMVRVGNLRKSHLVEATIRMQYLYSRETIEGEFIPLEQVDLHLDLKNDSDRLFLVTPQTICHPIDDKSPLFRVTKESLQSSDFEIIVILEGMVEATGMTTQARASYLPGEVLWGHRFENVISFSHTNGYNVDFRKFDTTYETPETPTCNASDLLNSELISNGCSDTSRTSRQSTSSTIRHIEDGNISEGRDSGFTAVEDDPGTDSTKTLNSDSSGGSCFSGSGTAPKQRNWLKRRKESREKRNSTEKSTTGPLEDGVGKKRDSIEKEAKITLERNEKNAELSCVSRPRKGETCPGVAEMPGPSPKINHSSNQHTISTIDETDSYKAKPKARKSSATSAEFDPTAASVVVVLDNSVPVARFEPKEEELPSPSRARVESDEEALLLEENTPVAAVAVVKPNPEYDDKEKL